MTHGEYLPDFSRDFAQPVQANISIILQKKEQVLHTQHLPPRRCPASLIGSLGSPCQDTTTCVPISPHARLRRPLAPFRRRGGTTTIATKACTSALRPRSLRARKTTVCVAGGMVLSLPLIRTVTAACTWASRLLPPGPAPEDCPEIKMPWI